MGQRKEQLEFFQKAQEAEFLKQGIISHKSSGNVSHVLITHLESRFNLIQGFPVFFFTGSLF